MVLHQDHPPQEAASWRTVVSSIMPDVHTSGFSDNWAMKPSLKTDPTPGSLPELDPYDDGELDDIFDRLAGGDDDDD